MDEFASYFDSYEHSSHKLADLLRDLPYAPDKVTISEKIEIGKKILSDMDKWISCMTHGMIGIPMSQREEAERKIRQCKSNISQLRSQLNKIELKGSSTTEFDGGIAEEAFLSPIDREGQLGQSVLRRTDQHLDEAERLISEVEDLGGAVMADMHDQRQKMYGIREKNRNVDQQVDKGKKLRMTMAQRMKCQKIALYVILALCICAVIGLIVWLASK
ncbi:Qb-SNARE protein, VTI1-family [Aduncisulcus paluster]|uniref:Qb-SNARE protein, VTI1-family n=1 Tax=Aduncisulcus paluster TaxID=2918883 RepID=A0ABQ5KS71_9EUKA|nr:Qb-SNARE protein, VTI1-family [Aduncisulcus paluster]